jgi:TonB family protein
MKNLLLIACLVAITNVTFGQTPDTTIHAVVDQMPLFPCDNEIEDFKERKMCSQKKMLEFIYTQINYPKEAREKLIEGTVVVRFIVEKDGSVSNIKTLRPIGGGCEEEVIRIVQSMPKWEAGINKDKKVRVQFNLPVKFKVDKNESKKKAITDRVFGTIDTMPRFPNTCTGSNLEKRECEKHLIEKFISDNVQYKVTTDEAVRLHCVIEKDGSVTNIKFEDSTNIQLNNEIKRMFELMPKWQAGVNEGKIIKTPLYIPISIYGNTKNNTQTVEIFYIVEQVEQMPKFPNDCEGADKERQNCSNQLLLKFIYDNIVYPTYARMNDIQGTVVVSFIVEKDGSITGAKIVRAIGGGCDEEVLRLMSLMTEKWEPGMQRGEFARVQFNLPIRFRLE